MGLTALPQELYQKKKGAVRPRHKFVVVNMEVLETRNHIIVEVLLGMHAVRAMLDTASRSLMERSVQYHRQEMTKTSR